MSLDVGLAIVLAKSLASPFFLEMELKYRINNYLHLHPHSGVGGYMAAFALALGLGACIFLVLRLTAESSITTKSLYYVGGIVSIAAVPACWLYADYMTGYGLLPLAADVHPLFLFWPFLELIVSVVFVLLYLFQKWPFSRAGSAILLVFHWVFWGWCLFGVYSWLWPPHLVFPTVGYCATHLWGSYVSSDREAMSATENMTNSATLPDR